jgi:hypothetical protein
MFFGLHCPIVVFEDFGHVLVLQHVFQFSRSMQALKNYKIYKTYNGQMHPILQFYSQKLVIKIQTHHVYNNYKKINKNISIESCLRYVVFCLNTLTNRTWDKLLLCALMWLTFCEKKIHNKCNSIH